MWCLQMKMETCTVMGATVHHRHIRIVSPCPLRMYTACNTSCMPHGERSYSFAYEFWARVLMLAVLCCSLPEWAFAIWGS